MLDAETVTEVAKVSTLAQVRFDVGCLKYVFNCGVGEGLVPAVQPTEHKSGVRSQQQYQCCIRL